MEYMKNRTGVVFQLKQDLLENDKLGFKRCDVNGVEIAEVVITLEEKLAAKETQKPANKPKSKSKKAKSVSENLQIPDEE